MIVLRRRTENKTFRSRFEFGLITKVIINCQSIAIMAPLSFGPSSPLLMYWQKVASQSNNNNNFQYN